MSMTGTHTIYDNVFLANEVEDQLKSKLDLNRLCTINSTLEGTPGMKFVVNRYKATDGTEKVKQGAGNTKSINVSFAKKEYEILLAQNRFEWYDEQAMTDPLLVPTGLRHMAVDMVNTIQADIYGEFLKTQLNVTSEKLDFNAFVDAAAKFNLEDDNQTEIFAIVSVEDVANLRKNLKDDLKYVEAFVRTGYIGTVAGVNIYSKKDAKKGIVVVGTREAVTVFLKKGVEVENTPRSADEANIRLNTIFTRKYYVAALTDETKAVLIKVGGAEVL